MTRFKAVNILTLLLPNHEVGVNKIRKLFTIPPDFDDLPLIRERTDKKYTGYLEAKDTVILMIEVAGHHEIYEITCEDDGDVDEIATSDILIVTSTRTNN